MNDLRILLCSSCMAIVAVKILQLHITFPSLNRKPFSCETCLSGWFCLVLSVPYVKWWWIPGYMAAAMILTVFINGLMRRV